MDVKLRRNMGKKSDTEAATRTCQDYQVSSIFKEYPKVRPTNLYNSVGAPPLYFLIKSTNHTFYFTFLATSQISWLEAFGWLVGCWYFHSSNACLKIAFREMLQLYCVQLDIYKTEPTWAPLSALCCLRSRSSNVTWVMLEVLTKLSNNTFKKLCSCFKSL